MDWCRQYHGEVCDPRWLGIARQVGEPLTPGHVYTVWGYAKECASKASPRGSVLDFDAVALSDFTGWPAALILDTMAAFCDRGMITDGFITDWLTKQPLKLAATNAQRQAKHRERVKAAEVQKAENANPVTKSNEIPVTRNENCYVTPTEEKEQSNCSFSDSSKQDTYSSLKLDTPRTVRERAGVVIDHSAFWSWIGQHGIPAHIGIRTMNRGKLNEWIEHGLTIADLDDAMSRATKKRAQQRSQHPVNIGFLACFVDEVLSGESPVRSAGGGYERGDQLSAKFANAG